MTAPAAIQRARMGSLCRISSDRTPWSAFGQRGRPVPRMESTVILMIWGVTALEHHAEGTRRPGQGERGPGSGAGSGESGRFSPAATV